MLAIKTIIHEWRKYLASIFSAAFCGALILSFIGLFSGVAESYSGLTSQSAAHLIVTNSKAASWFDASDFPKRTIPQLYSIRGVVDVAELRVSGAEWTGSSDDGAMKRVGVLVVSADIKAGSLNIPTSFSAETVNALNTTNTVAIDESSLKKLGVSIGSQAAINSRVIRIGGVVKGFPSANGKLIVFASRETGIRLGLVDESNLQITTLLVKVAEGSNIENIKESIGRLGGGIVKAWTKSELAEANQADLFLNGGFLGLILIFLLGLGTIIGTVVTWQTTKGAVVSNLREFGSLAALGVSINSLRLVVSQLSLIVGVMGYILANFLFVLVMLTANYIGLPMSYPVWSLSLVGIVFLLIVIVSGVLSIQVLNRAQPAELLR